MGLVAAKATVQTGTGIAGTTIDVALDLGGATPKIIRARCVGRTDVANAQGLANMNISHGLAAGATTQGCMAAFSQHNVSPSVTSKTMRTDCIVQALAAGGSVGKLAVNAVSADSVQFIVVEQFTANLAVQIDVLAGSDIANAKVHAWVLGVGTGAQSVTGVGHGARYVESIFNAAALNGALTSPINTCWGRSYIPGGLNQCFATRIGHNVSPSAANRYMNDAEGGALTATSSVIGRFTVTASTADGFDINRLEAPSGAWDVLSLVMDGTFRCNMGSGLTETGANVTTFDPGFAPALSLIDSHGTVESSIDTQQNGSLLTSGSLVGRIGAQSCMSFLAVNNVSPTVCGTGVAYDAVYINPNSGGTLDGKMAAVTPGLTSADITKVALQMSDPDPSQNFYLWTAFAPAAPVAGPAFIADIQRSNIASGAALGDRFTVSCPNLAAANEPVKVLQVYTAGYPYGGDPPSSDITLDDAAVSVGLGVASGAQIAYATFSESLADPTSCGSGRSAGDIYLHVTGAGAKDGAFRWIPSNEPGEVILEVTDSIPADTVLTFEAWGGDSIPDASIVGFERTTGTGTLSITTGLQARYCQMLKSLMPAGTDALSDANLSIGRCWIPTLTNHVVAYAADGGATPATDTARYGYEGEICADITPTGGGAFGGRATISAADATSVTLDRLESGTTHTAHLLSVAGSFAGALGNFRTNTSSTPFGPGAPAFTPKVESLWSVNRSINTQDTSSVHAALSLGAFVPDGGYAGVECVADNDNAGGTLVLVGFADATYGYGNALASVFASRVSAGSYQIATADDAQNYVYYAFFGDQEAGGGGATTARFRLGAERGTQLNSSQLRRGGFGVY